MLVTRCDDVIAYGDDDVMTVHACAYLHVSSCMRARPHLRLPGGWVGAMAPALLWPVTCLLALQGGLVVGRGDGTATLLPHSGTRCRRTQHWSGARVDRWNSAVVESLIVAMVEW